MIISLNGKFMYCNIFFKRLVLYYYHKIKNRRLIKFGFSTYLSHHCEFEGMNAVGGQSDFYGKMGRGSYVGCNCHISADIGRYSSLGNRISQIVETHPYKEPFVTTSPMFFSLMRQTGHTFARRKMTEEYRFYDYEREIAYRIGNDCWIGNDVCFIGGVQVGDGAVVLTHAIVTKDVPPYAIVGGIPAKVIGYRYDEETIDFLLKVRWWDKPVEWLREHWELLCDMEKFKAYFDFRSADSGNKETSVRVVKMLKV